MSGIAVFAGNLAEGRLSTYLEEAGHFVVSEDDDAVGFGLNFAPFVVVVGHVPATKSGLPLSVLQKDESDLANTHTIESGSLAGDLPWECCASGACFD
jgi:hypothetical protein